MKERISMYYLHVQMISLLPLHYPDCQRRGSRYSQTPYYKFPFPAIVNHTLPLLKDGSWKKKKSCSLILTEVICAPVKVTAQDDECDILVFIWIRKYLTKHKSEMLKRHLKRH